MPTAHDDHDDDDITHRGLDFDLSTMVHRRGALKMFGLGAAGLLTLRQCGTSCTPAGTGSCTVIPEETAGPYPGTGPTGPTC